MTWDIEVIADSDSRWKWGASLARRLAPTDDARVHATLLLGRSCPSDQQLRDVWITPATVRRESVAEAVDRLRASTAQVIVLACIGAGVQALLHALSLAWTDRTERPVVVTGYVGLVYENVIDGLVNRAGADVVLANSAADAERFREMFAGLGADPATVVQTALPFLGGAPYDPTAAGHSRPFTVTFVAQPGVPAGKADRRYVLTQAIEHLQRHPDRRVIVKLRGRPGERTTHVEPHHYASMLAPQDLPPALEFAYGPMSPVLDRTDICVTVSSTAAIEAMQRGIPTGFLTDFGIREILGNQLFLGSGAYTSWPALNSGAIPVPDPVWAARHGVGDLEPYAAATERVGALVASAATLPPLRPWLSVSDAPAFLAGVLAKYGIDADGRPVYVAQPSASRRAMRNVARRAYGVGVRTLEPRIKRIAQL